MRPFALILAGLVAVQAMAYADPDPPSTSTDAGFPAAYNCPAAPEPSVATDGGYFVPTARAGRLSCILEATAKHRDILIQQNDALMAEPAAPSWTTWLLVVLGVGVAGFAAGVAVGR